ncbi:MAG: ABC transporter permease, partial [Bacteroidales bacterium]
MKLLLTFIHKEMLHILRDVRTLIITLLMPVSLVILFGYVITNEIKDVKMAVYMPAYSQSARLLIDKFTSSGYFREVRMIDDEKEINAIMKEEGISMALIFPSDFERNLHNGLKNTVQIVVDASDMNSSQSIIGYSENILRNYLQEKNPVQSNKAPFSLEIKMMYNPSLKSVFMFLPGVLALIMLIVSAMMTAISIAREKELQTFRMLLVSPLKPMTIILGKVIPYSFLAVINTLLIIGLSVLIFKIPLACNLFLLTLICILFIATSLALGVVIGMKSPNQQVAIMISIIMLFLPTLMLSGFVFPIENMPVVLQWLSNIFPAKWFIILLRSVLIRG